jgi:hypothetical protein
VCPFKANCDTVVFSDYSKFFGIQVEILGIAYYLVIALFYSIFLFISAAAHQFILFIILSLSIIAFLFSLYLTFIQAFALKQWCSWCLISAGFCTIIFYSSLFASPYNITEIFRAYKEFIIGLHLLASAIGLGSVTVTDVLFNKFLRDLRISEKESDVLKTISEVIWVALALIVLSGLGLFLSNPDYYLTSDKFMVKMIVILVLIINGALLNLIIEPKLLLIPFGGTHHHEAGELIRLRKLAFALGAISIISWYSAFILGLFRTAPISFWGLLSVYVFLLVLAVIISQFVERLFAKRLP